MRQNITNIGTIGGWSPVYSSHAYPAYASGVGSYYYFPTEVSNDTDDKG